MPSIYLFSGPCGCGKTTLANAWAHHLLDSAACNQVYVIHGDDFHRGFAETERRVGPACPGFLYWPDILAFNWDCMLSVADKALNHGLDVIVDYVVEDELQLITELARAHQARLFYVVVTAEKEMIRRRLTERGDSRLTDRALFLKDKLDGLPENQGHLFDNTYCPVSKMIGTIGINQFEIKL